MDFINISHIHRISIFISQGSILWSKKLFRNFRIRKVSIVYYCRNSSVQEIKKAFREKSKLYHPDKAPGLGLDPNVIYTYIRLIKFKRHSSSL